MENELKIPQTTLDLKNCFENEGFVIDTCKQMSKDLVGLVNDRVDFDIDLNENVLNQITTTLIQVLNQMPNQNLQQFIYKVDLKEADFLKLIGDENKKEELAFKIIKREAQKIYLRRYFR